MLFKVALLLLTAAQALAHRIEIEPGQKECFHETLSAKDRVRGLSNSIVIRLHQRQANG
jgi:hypothetical protein